MDLCTVQSAKVCIYLDGISECVRCSEFLVEALPEPIRSTPVFLYVELVNRIGDLETGDAGLLSVVKSILKEAGISYFARDEFKELFRVTTQGPDGVC